MKTLPLYIDDRGRPASQCIRSGYCCKQAPCGFGVWDADKHQCKHLQQDQAGQYECGIACEIVTQPGWELSPAFGSGCCSPLNGDRAIILRRRKEAALLSDYNAL